MIIILTMIVYLYGAEIRLREAHRHTTNDMGYECLNMPLFSCSLSTIFHHVHCLSFSSLRVNEIYNHSIQQNSLDE